MALPDKVEQRCWSCRWCMEVAWDMGCKDYTPPHGSSKHPARRGVPTRAPQSQTSSQDSIRLAPRREYQEDTRRVQGCDWPPWGPEGCLVPRAARIASHLSSNVSLTMSPCRGVCPLLPSNMSSNVILGVCPLLPSRVSSLCTGLGVCPLLPSMVSPSRDVRAALDSMSSISNTVLLAVSASSQGYEAMPSYPRTDTTSCIVVASLFTCCEDSHLSREGRNYTYARLF